MYIIVVIIKDLLNNLYNYFLCIRYTCCKKTYVLMCNAQYFLHINLIYNIEL